MNLYIFASIGGKWFRFGWFEVFPLQAMPNTIKITSNLNCDPSEWEFICISIIYFRPLSRDKNMNSRQPFQNGYIQRCTRSRIYFCETIFFFCFVDLRLFHFIRLLVAAKSPWIIHFIWTKREILQKRRKKRILFRCVLFHRQSCLLDHFIFASFLSSILLWS